MARNLLVAVLMLAVGAAVCYFMICQPYQQMAAGESSISITDKGLMFGPFIVCMGVGLLLAALFTKGPAPGKQSRAGNWIIGIFAVIGIVAGGYVAFSWMPDQQAKFGYFRGD